MMSCLQMAALKELTLEARLKRLVSCVHSVAFMQRYRSDLDTRETRRKELAHRWCAVHACTSARSQSGGNAALVTPALQSNPSAAVSEDGI